MHLHFYTSLYMHRCIAINSLRKGPPGRPKSSLAARWHPRAGAKTESCFWLTEAEGWVEGFRSSGVSDFGVKGFGL